ncbi:hypothetical protein BD410DRAFT_286531 [Rickenella mellea]|uniref:Uncharacterized protein n=1 Tax=Rickenella mellea TaxID=50990 RepID=A0A4Y7Q1Y3_9AGAM|nr:hypothetical protein BD410DRAFT_286531 [Rickenella mellea]
MLAKAKPLIRAQILLRTSKRNYINKLPVKLLVEIFLFCLPTHRFPTTSRREAPLLLGRVCRIWCSVSLSTPQLWTQLTIADPDWSRMHHGEDSESIRSLNNAWNSDAFHRFGIQEWLRRSGNSPFSFRIGRHHEYHLFVPLLTRTLQAEAYRWNAVTLDDNCRCNNYIWQMLRSPEKTPMLTDLRFGLSVYPSENTTLQALSCAARLSSLYSHSMNVVSS